MPVSNLRSFLFLTFAIGRAASISCSEATVHSNEEATAAYYQDLISTPKANVAGLNQFFTLMPKGGDIHHHYSGSIYAETFLDWVKKDNQYINTTTFAIESSLTITNTTVDLLRMNEPLYLQLLDAWSDKDFGNHFHNETPPDEKFFATFGYFGSLASKHIPEGLEQLKNRAIAENVQYIETMLSSLNYVPRTAMSDTNAALGILQALRDAGKTRDTLQKLWSSFHSDPDFRTLVGGFVTSLTQAQSKIDDGNFTMRYQTYAFRGASPVQVFASLCAAFEADKQSDLIVGVNIVGPENGVVALRDYWLHMQMFAFLSGLNGPYREAKVAMHAGELALGMVPPEDLKFHIFDAVNTAGANRIGHGVDIPFETNSLDLLRRMAEQKTAVEINLTSNEFILGIKGSAHPLSLYRQMGVPVVISTDDSGVSRNNLTGEYVLLANRYRPSYSEIKGLVNNSITYSFLRDSDRQTVLKRVANGFTKFENTIATLKSRSSTEK